MGQIYHKGLDINEIITGRTHKDIKTGVEAPIIRAILQNGLNKRDSNSGLFVPCDMGLTERVRDRNPWRVNEGRYGHLSFVNPSALNKHEVTLQYESGTGIRLRYEGANCSFESITDNKPKFKAQKGVTIEHTPTYKGVAVVMVLDDPLNAPDSFKFSIEELGTGYTYKAVNGGILLDGPEPIMIHAPWAEDANGERGEVVLELGPVEGGSQTIIKRIVDIAWLRQAIAPVQVDPYVVIDDSTGIIGDFIMSSFSINQDRNYGNWPAMGAHRNAANNQTTGWHKVDLSAYSNITVTDSYWGLDVYNIVSTPTVYGYKCLRDVIEGTKSNATATTGEPSWNDYAVPNAWDIGGGRGAGTDRAGTEDNSQLFSINSDFHFAVSNSLVQFWVENPASNFGELFDIDTVPQRALWRSSEKTTGNLPYFYMEYTEGAAEGIQILRRRRGSRWM